MPTRDWVSFAPVGVAVIVVLMLLASALVNHQNEPGCALGMAGPDCRQAIRQSVGPLLGQAPDAIEDAQRFRLPAEPDQGLPWGSPLSLYLLIATLVLAAATFAVVAVVAIRQHRLNQAAAQRNDDDSVSTDRIVKLVESVAAVLRALEERTRELETGLRELGAERTAQGEKLAAIAASLEQVRTDQAEADRRLEGALASTVEEFGKHQGALVDNLLPNIARRDERLVAIDANITATADRLAKLGADTERNARETAVLAECFGSLETSMSELTSGLVELRGAPQGGREGRPEEPAGPQDSDTSDASMGSSEEPTTDSEESSPSTASREAPTD